MPNPLLPFVLEELEKLQTSVLTSEAARITVANAISDKIGMEFGFSDYSGTDDTFFAIVKDMYSPRAVQMVLQLQKGVDAAMRAPELQKLVDALILAADDARTDELALALVIVSARTIYDLFNQVAGTHEAEDMQEASEISSEIPTSGPVSGVSGDLEAEKITTAETNENGDPETN